VRDAPRSVPHLSDDPPPVELAPRCDDCGCRHFAGDACLTIRQVPPGTQSGDVSLKWPKSIARLNARALELGAARRAASHPGARKATPATHQERTCADCRKVVRVALTANPGRDDWRCSDCRRKPGR